MIDTIESRDIDKEQDHDQKRVDDRIAADEVKQNVIRRAVSPHQEHVIVRNRDVRDISQNAEHQHSETGKR